MQTDKFTTKPVHEVISAIRALALQCIRTRLMDSELGLGWTEEHAASVEAAYRTYLSMLARHQQDAEEIMVSTDVDEFWHAHILHTRKYAEDCDKVFGAFIHHEPQARTGT